MPPPCLAKTNQFIVIKVAAAPLTPRQKPDVCWPVMMSSDGWAPHGDVMVVTNIEGAGYYDDVWTLRTGVMTCFLNYIRGQTERGEGTNHTSDNINPAQ